MSTSWSRSLLRYFQYSRNNDKTLHELSKWCWCGCHCIIFCLGWNDCWNPEFGCSVHLISFMEVVHCILTSWVCEFVKLHLILPKPLHALLYSFGNCAHHPAGFIIFAQLARHSLRIILIIQIFPIVGIWKITQTVAGRYRHHLKRRFGFCIDYSCVLCILYIFLLFRNRCRCVLNSLPYPVCFSLNTILHLFFYLFIA